MYRSNKNGYKTASSMSEAIQFLNNKLSRILNELNYLQMNMSQLDGSYKSIDNRLPDGFDRDINSPFVPYDGQHSLNKKQREYINKYFSKNYELDETEWQTKAGNFIQDINELGKEG